MVVAVQQMGLPDDRSLLAGVAVARGLHALAMVSGPKLPRWSGAAD